VAPPLMLNPQVAPPLMLNPQASGLDEMQLQLQLTVTGSMRNLIMCERGRRELVNASGALSSLLAMVSPEDPDQELPVQVRRAAGGALVNLSSVDALGCEALIRTPKCLETLTYILDQEVDPNLRCYCATVVCNLTANKQTRPKITALGPLISLILRHLFKDPSPVNQVPAFPTLDVMNG
ncbi:hypothetical protein CYMTET_17282, partial [Cymbomonas tetramitiformis]